MRPSRSACTEPPASAHDPQLPGEQAKRGMDHDLDAFRVGHEAEIAALLVQLRNSGTPVAMVAPDGSSVTGRLWSLDAAAGRLHFGVDADAPSLHTLLAADEGVAVASLQQIQLQFPLSGLTLVRGADDATLQADWPESLVRLQRRESFRLKTSGRAAPTLTMRHPSMPDMTLDLRILDVSIGGCALLLPADVPELAPGIRIASVRVQLDLETRFEGGLLLHHISAFEGAEGPRRIGCAWDELEVAAERALQRYILATQKRQRRLGWT